MKSRVQIQHLDFAEKQVDLYIPEAEGPLVLLHTVQGEGAAVWEACRRGGCPPFALAAVSGLVWNRDMTPWAIPPFSPDGETCTGGADAYLAQLRDSILPLVRAQMPTPPRYLALAGYSLAGLFALYATCRTDVFRRVASASGSFWYPGFTEFVQQQETVFLPEKICFSLGEKESRTRNPLMAAVREKTEWLVQHYAAQGVQTDFTLNPGGHFTDPEKRMAAEICRMLTEKEKPAL